MVEAVLQLQSWVPPLAGDHASDVVEVSAGRLLAEDVQLPLEPGGGHLWRHVVRQANEQYVQRLLEESAVMRIMPHALGGEPLPPERAIADRHGVEVKGTVDGVTAGLA